MRWTDLALMYLLADIFFIIRWLYPPWWTSNAPCKALKSSEVKWPQKTGQYSLLLIPSVRGRLQAPLRSTQTWSHERFYLHEVQKAEEMRCFMETDILFGPVEIFPNRRLFDSSPHLKPSVNLLSGSFNKSFFFLNRLKLCSGQMRGFYEERPRCNKLQPIGAVFTKAAALPQTRLYCRPGHADMSFTAQPWSVSLWEPPARGRLSQLSGSSTGPISRRDIGRNHDHISY